MLLVAAVVLPLLPSRRVPPAARRAARALLGALGVRHVAAGRLASRRALVVANHVSWLDVVVLLAHLPARMLAKREVRGWPVVGRLAVAMGTVFIDRDRPRELPRTVAAVAGALAAGGVVAAFPEGTTWCGLSGGPLRPAVFQAAVGRGRRGRPGAHRVHAGRRVADHGRGVHRRRSAARVGAPGDHHARAGGHAAGAPADSSGSRLRARRNAPRARRGRPGRDRTGSRPERTVHIPGTSTLTQPVAVG